MTSKLMPAMPFFTPSSMTSSYSSGASAVTFFSPSRRTEGEGTRFSSAPTIMSPAAPAKQSR